MIKIIEFLNEKLVIGQIDILEEEPKILMRQSFLIVKIKNGIVLKPYPTYAESNTFLADSKNILTIYTPEECIMEKYFKLAKELYIDGEEETDANAILNTLFEDE